ncbi:MAG: hypothetical protein R2847_04180 [Bacteroidia bacterium]
MKTICFPGDKIDYSGKVVYLIMATMPILSYWQCKLNEPVNNQAKMIYLKYSIRRHPKNTIQLSNIMNICFIFR